MQQHRTNLSGTSGPATGAMRALLRRSAAAVNLLGLLLISALITACGSGGGSAGVSSQTVSGVAATGAPLVGQITLRDSSATYKDKVTVIADDGSYSIDVSGMRAPFLLKASGVSDGERHTLYSFADKPGIANINPLSSVAVASAAGVDDPAEAFDKPDPVMLDKLRYGLHGSVNTLKSKIKLLLETYSVADADPVSDPFKADHTGLDGMFDNVKVVLSKGTLTISNATTGAVIFTARVSAVARGSFTDNHDDLPKPGPRPAAPAGVSASGGDGQVTVSWEPVENATSYDLYYSTKSRSAEETEGEDEEAKQVKDVSSPYVLTGLKPDTTYYFTVRALANHRRSPSSAEVSASTSAVASEPSIPAAPAGVAATGGTKQTTVTWSEVSGASSYNLYWSSSAGVTTANGTKIGGVTSPAVHTELTDGATYYYIVTSVNSAGESPASVQVAATTLNGAPAAGAPDAPTGVSAIGGDKQVTLSWPAVAGADSYNIYWSATSGLGTSGATRIAAVTSPYVHTGLADGSAYFYVLTAVNASGESLASPEATASTDVAAIDGAALYTQYCSGCHGPLGSSDKQGATAAQITSGIANAGSMYTRFNATSGTLIKLTPEQIAAISAALQ